MPVSTSREGALQGRELCPRALTIVVMQVAIASMRRFSTLLVASFLAGCSTNAIRIDRLAETLGMSRSVVEAGGFRSLVFTRGVPTPHDAPLAIFIEGDGVPWVGGREPSLDPTTADPLALKLLGETPPPTAYVTRPCYNDMGGQRCTPERWTMERYSDEIVSSMTEVVRTLAQQSKARSVMLVGYSGGGVLAVLIAERLDNVAAVVTVGANLDVDAWTRHHGYLPLTGSLNPAASTAVHRWPETHLYGTHDENVPPATTDAYFKRFPHAQRRLEANDHLCCWVEQWPELWKQLAVTDAR
jgi:dienelactone hydrolase family protein